MASEQARPTTCPSCGQTYDPSRTTYCDNCGQRFPWAAAAEPVPGLMIARLMLGIGAAALFGWVGLQLVTLQDVGDPAIATGLHLMGWLSFGMALVAIAIALPHDRAGES